MSCALVPLEDKSDARLEASYIVQRFHAPRAGAACWSRSAPPVWVCVSRSRGESRDSRVRPVPGAPNLCPAQLHVPISPSVTSSLVSPPLSSVRLSRRERELSCNSRLAPHASCLTPPLTPPAHSSPPSIHAGRRRLRFVSCAREPAASTRLSRAGVYPSRVQGCPRTPG